VRGRLPEAVSALQRAAQLDAGSPVAVGMLGLTLALSGRQADGLVAAERAVSYDSALVMTQILLGATRLYARQPAPALRPLATAAQLDPSSTLALGLLGYAYAVSGDLDAAHRTSARIEGLPDGPGKEVALARIAVALGDTAQAATRLERAARAKDPFFASEPARSPIWTPLLANARYQSLLRSVGL
jgi:tetratricopeptide (TPR) repeat protein